MADIELVIKIPEVRYNQILDKNHTIEHYLEDAVKNGTPLPKGHGRLKDVDRLESHDEYDGQGFTESIYKDDIDNLPIIIEADKESEEQE